MKKTKLILSWIIRIITSILFLLASVGKIMSAPEIIKRFNEWGFPNGFHFIIGILELVLAVLLLIPKTLKIAVYSLVIIMVGASITHIINDPILETIRPLIFMVFLGVIYYLNFYKLNKI